MPNRKIAHQVKGVRLIKYPEIRSGNHGVQVNTMGRTHIIFLRLEDVLKGTFLDQKTDGTFLGRLRQAYFYTLCCPRRRQHSHGPLWGQMRELDEGQWVPSLSSPIGSGACS